MAVSNYYVFTCTYIYYYSAQSSSSLSSLRSDQIRHIVGHKENGKELEPNEMAVHVKSSTPCLVQPTLADVAHPLDDVMVTVVQLWLKHLQVAYLEARWGKRHLKKTRQLSLKLHILQTAEQIANCFTILAHKFRHKLLNIKSKMLYYLC